MKILILGLNYAPEMVGISVYTTGLAEALVRRGHDVRVIAGKPYYPAWKVPEDHRGGWWRRGMETGVDVTRVAHFVPANPTGARRILHHVSFALSSLIPLLIGVRQQRPDLLLTVAPSLIAAPIACFGAAVCGAKSWLHVQDFEVEAAMVTGLVGKTGFAARLAMGFEQTVLRLFDRVSSISPAMCRKSLEKGVAPFRVAEFRNWADIDRIVPLGQPSLYRAEWNITTPHVALYSGNIANKQGIEIVVAAARRLKHRTDLTFVVCGEGPSRTNLETLANDLTNIQFHDLQPKERLNDLVGLATVHLLPQLAGAADLVLPSKLTNMLASGRAVVAAADPGTGLADEVMGCGLVVPPENEGAFAEAIAHLIDNDTERDAFGVAARIRAEERWARDAIIDGFERSSRNLCGVGVPMPGEDRPMFQDLARSRVAPGFRGRSGVIVLLWQLVQGTLFRLSPQPLYAWRRFLLRLFGARVGKGVLVRPSVRVTYPWKVTLGDYSWVGDNAEIYSLGPISIGSNAVVSQRTYLCAGTHDPTDITFPLVAKPIVVEPEAWIATDCFIAPGVTIGRGAIIAARSTVLADVPSAVVAAGSPATGRKPRVPNSSRSRNETGGTK